MKILVEKAVIERVLKALVEADRYYDYDAIITALREALTESDWVCDEQDAKVAKRFKRYRAGQAEQEPVRDSFIRERQQLEQEWCELRKLQQAYAAPVRTKDLTDDEIAKAIGLDDLDLVTIGELEDARAVIAADREKNK